ncbi:unnamed protein product [Blumeria hordei]|uniref:Profilin n=1 Tax=Blumeria hordei TaxID=2867405 RepID=A0A383UJL4_BLUHO|nr:unnamed protein product [Blumeria hordei]
MSMIGSGHADKGAIFGFDDLGMWASSTGFNITPEEIKVIHDALNSANLEKLQSEGIFIAGVKYVFSNKGVRSLYARKGTEGVVIVNTAKTILIAHHNDTMIAGNCSTVIEGLADYLGSSGY